MRLIKPLPVSNTFTLHTTTTCTHSSPVSHLQTHQTAGVQALPRPQSGVFSITCLDQDICVYLSGVQDELCLHSW